MKYIIVLGSTNDDKGIISDIGRQRLDKGVEIFKLNKDYRLILTGGFGNHFNTTNRPYSSYAKEYLIDKGIPEASIMELVLSKDTIEDAKLTYSLLRDIKISHIFLITSDFHMNRVKFIFNKIFVGYNIDFVEVRYVSSPEKLNKLNEVEQKEMHLLRTTGKSSVGSSLSLDV